MKKLFVLAALCSCICAIAAEASFKKWTIANTTMRKNIVKYVSEKDGVLTLNGVDGAFNFFQTNAVDVKYGCSVIISGKASGKGSVNVGFLGYRDKGYSATASDAKKIMLTDKPQPFNFKFVITNSNTGAVRPLLAVIKNSNINISDYKVEVISSVFDGWTIMAPAVRKNESTLVDKTVTGAKFIAKDKNYGYFHVKGFPVEVGQKVRFTGKISGKGSASCAILGYVDSGYKNTMYMSGKINVTAEPAEFNVVLPVGRANTHHCRPVVNIGKNSEIIITDFKISVEK